jgi:hypothetical protein
LLFPLQLLIWAFNVAHKKGIYSRETVAEQGSNERFTFIPLQFKDLRVDAIYEDVNKTRINQKMDPLDFKTMYSMEKASTIHEWIWNHIIPNNSFPYWYKCYNQDLKETPYEELLEKLIHLGADEKIAPWNKGEELDYSPVPKNIPLVPSDVAVVVAEIQAQKNREEDAKKLEKLEKQQKKKEAEEEKKKKKQEAEEKKKPPAPQVPTTASGKSPYVNIYFVCCSPISIFTTPQPQVLVLPTTISHRSVNSLAKLSSRQ